MSKEETRRKGDRCRKSSTGSSSCSGRRRSQGDSRADRTVWTDSATYTSSGDVLTAERRDWKGFAIVWICRMLPAGQATRHREQRVHWNAATAYPHMKAQLLDLLEEATPLPTDLCGLVLEHVWPGLESCFPLPAGRAQLNEPSYWHLRQGAIQLRGGVDDTGAEPVFLQWLPFRGGGRLQLAGPLFEGQASEDAETGQDQLTWYVLRTLMAPTRTPKRIRYHDAAMLQSMEATAAAAAADENDEQAARKRRRYVKDKDTDPRWVIHQQEFAFYQVLPFGINLIREPGHSSAAAELVSGVCLVLAEREEVDAAHGSVIYSVQAAAATPLSGRHHQVAAYFRPAGVCDWAGGRCARHAASGCASACCSDEHCAAAGSASLCDVHQLGR